MRNLWPTEIEIAEITPPVTILYQQAEMLGQLTNKKVLGDVRARDDEEDTFTYDFYIAAPFLGNYRYKLLTVSYGVDLYPVTIQIEESIFREFVEKTMKIGKYSIKADSEDDFLEALKVIFNSSKAKRVISSLLAQSTADAKMPSQEE